MLMPQVSNLSPTSRGQIAIDSMHKVRALSDARFGKRAELVRVFSARSISHRPEPSPSPCEPHRGLIEQDSAKAELPRPLGGPGLPEGDPPESVVTSMAGFGEPRVSLSLLFLRCPVLLPEYRRVAARAFCRWSCADFILRIAWIGEGPAFSWYVAMHSSSASVQGVVGRGHSLYPYPDLARFRPSVGPGRYLNRYRGAAPL
jgi:hypothetical protein